jgi:stringent starvation protein B
MKIDSVFINKEKQKAITHGLEGQFVLVHFDPHAEGVKIPEFLLDRPSVTLKLSYFFKRILHVTPEKVTAELLFGDMYYTCIIPYEAVWGVARDGEGLMMWPGSVPPEVAHILGAAATTAKTESPLTLVKDGPAKEGTPLKAVESTSKKKASKKKPILKAESAVKAKPAAKKATKKTKKAAEEAATESLPPPAPKNRERPKLVRVK